MTYSALAEPVPQMAVPLQSPIPVNTLTDVVLDLAIRGSVEMVQRVVVSPIDRVMLLTAVEGELVRQGRLPRHGFRSLRRCFGRLWRKEGVRGLLRGVLADAAMTPPSLVVDAVAGYVVQLVFATAMPEAMSRSVSPGRLIMLTQVALFAMSWVASPYNGLRKTIMTNYIADIVAPIPAPFAHVTSDDAANKSAAALSMERLAKTPESPVVEEAYRYTSATDAARTIYHRHGWRGFFRGIAIDPIAVCAYRGLYLMAVVTLNDNFVAQHPLLPRRALAVLANVVTQPLEVVGRRLVLTASDTEGRCYKGAVDCARTIVREEGVTALWSGLKFRLILTGVSIGAAMLYEAVARRRGA